MTGTMTAGRTQERQALNRLYHGSLTALVTPFLENGDVDRRGFAGLVERQIAGGTRGLVPMGTTGESPTLTHEEHLGIIETCVTVTAGRVPVMAGAGSNCTREAVDMARQAARIGADALLVVVPYYNKPTQEGLYRHFMSIADATDLPLWLYCIPGRSVVNLSIETMGRLATHPNIVGTKDATADMTRPIAVRRVAGADFNQLSGEDGSILSFRAAGGHGCISVTSNVAPALCSQLHELWESGKTEEAIALQDRLSPLHDALFAETSPGPVKYALSRLGLCRPELRLPLVEPRPETRQRIDAALQALELME
ncbi:4-hydroxy-tetrahydrodipicolinate synthase [Oecophyllibacter saccharovorans]|uniref:4-hydroxy-tetrahydrodipicolinate synthase n=1 Tax=Oecophyllibacter saccharovorans TaxID=2558360 RepID=A0A506UQE0_9PROT|nr:4-hydroxy-tetrahydrodipicolinate synthase [Oecophyllibacter saccharovorans]QDH15753.1 4-hydroxy-tetrahydrodipicolinate synthase [Oecophyllibacter saccharovorans]TPW35534.1 4-hydroxy-tetrahydrodipicolinate synthase [Oecophyllibacter saccharovorans]